MKSRQSSLPAKEEDVLFLSGLLGSILGQVSCCYPKSMQHLWQMMAFL